MGSELEDFLNSSRQWLPEEDRVLLEHACHHGTKAWGSLVASGKLPRRDNKACCNRYRLLKRRIEREAPPRNGTEISASRLLLERIRAQTDTTTEAASNQASFEALKQVQAPLPQQPPPHAEGWTLSHPRALPPGPGVEQQRIKKQRNDPPVSWGGVDLDPLEGDHFQQQLRNPGVDMIPPSAFSALNADGGIMSRPSSIPHPNSNLHSSTSSLFQAGAHAPVSLNFMRAVQQSAWSQTVAQPLALSGEERGGYSNASPLLQGDPRAQGASPDSFNPVVVGESDWQERRLPSSGDTFWCTEEDADAAADGGPVFMPATQEAWADQVRPHQDQDAVLPVQDQGGGRQRTTWDPGPDHPQWRQMPASAAQAEEYSEAVAPWKQQGGKPGSAQPQPLWEQGQGSASRDDDDPSAEEIFTGVEMDRVRHRQDGGSSAEQSTHLMRRDHPLFAKFMGSCGEGDGAVGESTVDRHLTSQLRTITAQPQGSGSVTGDSMAGLRWKDEEQGKGSTAAGDSSTLDAARGHDRTSKGREEKGSTGKKKERKPLKARAAWSRKLLSGEQS